jgi:acetyl esterase/lipase
MMIYPFLDMRNNSKSAKLFTDTPMWNSALSAKVQEIVNPGNACTEKILTSPVEAESLENLPPAYIETAEFDCLHDDGILYADRLRDAGVETELFETKGTMHGFDIVLEAPTTQDAIFRRIAFMRRYFYK